MTNETKATSRKSSAAASTQIAAAAKSPSRLDQLQALLLRDTGATIAEMVAATGWQQHSVRGAIAGALRERGLIITSSKIDDVRRYRAQKPA